jgi:hypothetical protein
LSPGRSKVLPNENWFYEAKLKLRTFTGIIKGLSEKFKN